MEENNIFSKLCWVCLAEESNMHPLFERDKKVEVDNIKEPISLYDLLSYVLSANIFYIDGPHLICNSCKIQACSAYRFKKRCDISSNIFQKCGLTAYNDDEFNSYRNKFQNTPSTINVEQSLQNVNLVPDDLLSKENEDVKQEIIKTENDENVISTSEDNIYEKNVVFEIIEDDSITFNENELEKSSVTNQEVPVINKNCIKEIDKISISANQQIQDVSSHNLEELSKVSLQQKNCTGVDSLVITEVFSIKEEIMTKPSFKRKKSVKIKDTCYYCKNKVSNFARHLLRHHQFESEVKTIRSIPTGSKERKHLFTILRKKGNFVCNGNDFKPVKKSTAVKNLDRYLACTNCLGYYSRKFLARHRKKCSGKQDYSKVYLGSDNFLLNSFQIDEKLTKDIFPIMRNDRVSHVARTDVLICAFGAYCIKVHKVTKATYVVSRKMRELAKLLIEIQKLAPCVTNLFEALDPNYYSIIVQATKIVGQYNTNMKNFNSPTYVLSIGSSLNRCCDIAISCTENTEGISDTVKSNLQKIRDIFLLNWKEDVSSQAILCLNLKWNDVTLVSLANDLKLLIDYVINKANDACLKLLTNLEEEYYAELMETIFCRLALLNRRHYLTLQKLSWKDYETLQEFNNQSSEGNSLSEKILLQNFKKLCVNDKHGFNVPIYISYDVYQHIKMLNELRSNFSNVSNKFLFAISNSSNLIYSNKTLMKHCKKCGVKNPLAILSTKFRNNIQILAQLFFLKENEMEGLKQFFNKKIDLNESLFHSNDSVCNMINISKSLLTVKETTPDILSMEPQTQQEDNKEQPNSLDAPQELETTLTFDKLETSTLEQTPDSKTEVAIGNKPKIQRTPWTSEQKRVVMSFFKDHIKLKNPPKRKECEELISMHSDLLKNKTWLKIKVFIQNVYVKGIPKY